MQFSETTTPYTYAHAAQLHSGLILFYSKQRSALSTGANCNTAASKGQFKGTLRKTSTYKSCSATSTPLAGLLDNCAKENCARSKHAASVLNQVLLVSQQSVGAVIQYTQSAPPTHRPVELRVPCCLQGFGLTCTSMYPLLFTPPRPLSHTHCSTTSQVPFNFHPRFNDVG